MKEIKAIVRPHRLDAVLDALHANADLPGVTISTVRGFGRRVGRSSYSDTTPIQYGTAQMAKLECVVDDDLADAVVDLIQIAAQTEQIGDGKIFVYDVRRAVRIRDGARLERI